MRLSQELLGRVNLQRVQRGDRMEKKMEKN